MKKIIMLCAILLSVVVVPSYANSINVGGPKCSGFVTTEDPSFCGKFISESVEMCTYAGGGSWCASANSPQGMRKLYNAMVGPFDGNLAAGCNSSVPKGMRGCAGTQVVAETANCPAKWNKFISQCAPWKP